MVSMARLSEILNFAKKHDLKVGTVSDLIKYRLKNNKIIKQVSERPFETDKGNDFILKIFENSISKEKHYALVKNINQDIYKTLLKSESLNKKKYLNVTVNYKGPIKAPIKKNDILGKLKVAYKDEIVEEYDLFAFEDIKKLNVFSRLMKSINFLIWGDV